MAFVETKRDVEVNRGDRRLKVVGGCLVELFEDETYVFCICIRWIAGMMFRLAFGRLPTGGVGWGEGILRQGLIHQSLVWLRLVRIGPGLVIGHNV